MDSTKTLGLTDAEGWINTALDRRGIRGDEGGTHGAEGDLPTME